MRKSLLIGAVVLLVGVIGWLVFDTPSKTGDWQSALSVLSTAEFNGDLVTVKNIRNFRYNGSEEEKDAIPAYYDKTFDLTKLKQVWFIADPFQENALAAHTFLSFEFENQQYLSISIEARKLKGQKYDLVKGMFHTYPIMYIAADERDTIFARTNIRKDEVFVYPVKTTQEKARALFVDMANEMNSLAVKPEWYNTLFANCTSRIGYHINRVTPGRIPFYSLAPFVTGLADRFALEHGLINTDLSLEQAREKYKISSKALEIGNVENFSELIRSSGSQF
ncbi:MAG: DUF4105 domain-containing protein [Candidatus Uhrbacteria bacterium]